MRRPYCLILIVAAFCGGATLPGAVALGAAAGDPTQTVFRCTDAAGRVVYTDVPCGNPTLVELHPGRADPAAAQRRAAAQAELDAGMTALRAREAERRAGSYPAYPPYEPIAFASPDAYVDPGFAWPVYGPAWRPDGKRPRPRPPEGKPVPPPVSKVPARPRLPTAATR